MICLFLWLCSPARFAASSTTIIFIYINELKFNIDSSFRIRRIPRRPNVWRFRNNFVSNQPFINIHPSFRWNNINLCLLLPNLKHIYPKFADPCSCGVRSGFTAVHLLRLKVRIPQGHGCLSSVNIAPSKVGVYASGYINCPEHFSRAFCFWAWSFSLGNEETLSPKGLSRHALGGDGEDY
jgi:hypothetical protein